MALSRPEPIQAAHDLESFSCGKPMLDNWLKKRALSNHQNSFTSVVVVHEAMRVVAYYGLAPTSVFPSAMPRSIRTGQPPDPVPCLLLCQLATDTACGGRGLGSALVAHALGRCLVAARLIGGRAVVLRAIDDEAAGFWKRHGFRAGLSDPLLMFRSMQDIELAVSARG